MVSDCNKKCDTKFKTLFFSGLALIGFYLMLENFDLKVAWKASDLINDKSWIFSLNDLQRSTIIKVIKNVYDPDRRLFDYQRDEFDFGSGLKKMSSAIREAYHGRGIALLRGLPRYSLNEKEFLLMNWGIGLHFGVARPQGKMTQYLSSVRNVGTDYRASNGRGYSSNARLDFHADGTDIVLLSCFNKAKTGGQSMITSSVSAYRILCHEHPDLAEIAHQDFFFSRQKEEAPGENSFYGQPLFDICDGRLFGKWNRNRVRSAQNIKGVPKLNSKQKQLMDKLDEILTRPELMYTMFLEPGDMQFLNNHVMLHSRTDYIDHKEPEKFRLLQRLWLAPPDSIPLPKSWGDFFRSIKPGTVRGGIRGHHHDDACKAFEARQAAELGMKLSPEWKERKIFN